MGKKAVITDENLEESRQLKAIFEARNTLSQLKFGTEYDIGTQGMVWQYLNGKSALNTDAALKFAKGLNCSVADFSPRLAKLLPTPPARIEKGTGYSLHEPTQVYTTYDHAAPPTQPLSPLMVAAQRLDRAPHVPESTKSALTALLKSILSNATQPEK